MKSLSSRRDALKSIAGGVASVATVGAWRPVHAVGTNDVKEIHAALAKGKQNGGGTVIVEGRFVLDRPLRLPDGVRLEGRDATLVAGKEMPTMVMFEPRADNCQLAGFTLDGAGYAKRLVHGVGNRNPLLTECSGINFQTGYDFVSMKDRAAENVQIRKVSLEKPSPGAINSVIVRSTTGGPIVKGAVFEDVTVIGSGGHYTRQNNATGDQIVLQGVQDFRLTRCNSHQGGEVGITVSRLSANGVIENCLATYADGHGFNIGSAFFAVEVNDASQLVAKEKFTSSTGARGWIQVIDGSVLYLNRVVFGRLAPGDVIQQGPHRVVVRNVTRSQNILLRNCVAEDNWRNVEPNRGAGGGFFVQQADNIFLEDCLSRNTVTQNQLYGLLYAQSKVGWRRCEFIGNVRRDFQGQGDYERIEFPA